MLSEPLNAGGARKTTRRRHTDGEDDGRNGTLSQETSSRGLAPRNRGHTDGEDEAIRRSMRRSQRTASTGFSTGETGRYAKTIEQAREQVGYGSMKGAFPEEWNVQLLVHSTSTSDGTAVVICVPNFLRTIADDDFLLQQALQFLLLSMDSVAMRAQGKYIVIVGVQGWTQMPVPKMIQLFQSACNIVPKRYSKNLQAVYILHSYMAWRLSLAASQSWLIPRAWDKVQYVDSIEECCRLVHPDSEEKRATLKKHLPFVVHRRDAELLGEPIPALFGMPLKKVCHLYGVHHADRTTGRNYPALPFPIVVLCEKMERDEAEVDFANMFSVPAKDMYELVDAIDQGAPLESETKGETMWGVLKMFLDCLHEPLLSFRAIDLFHEQGCRTDDYDMLLKFLINLVHNILSEEIADVVLYLASFFNTMCNSPNLAQELKARQARRSSVVDTPASAGVNVVEQECLTPELAAEVFAPAFLRTKEDGMDFDAARVARALLLTLIQSAQDERLWPSRHSQDEDVESRPS